MMIKVICDFCGKEFEIFPCYMKQEKHYCCRKCANAAKKGKSSWNKGLTKEIDIRVLKYANTKKGKKFTKEHKLALSKVKMGKPSPRKGAKLTEETKQKLSSAHRGQIPWIKGKHHTEETKQKLSKLKLGKKYPPDKLKSILIKKEITYRKNKSWTKSGPEEKIYELLINKFNKVIRQHESEIYPFHCDFYIPELDLYIEYQGHWNHGKKPFENSKEDLEKLNIWKEKSLDHEAYLTAINVWTVRDPLKRKTAKENNLNWLEFFNMNEFENWYKTILT